MIRDTDVRQAAAQWVQGVARREEQVDSIHLDELDPRFRNPALWEGGLQECLGAAEALRLPPGFAAELRRVLRAHPAVERAWLVRKPTRHLCDQPVAMLVVRCTVPWYRLPTTVLAPTAAALVPYIVLPENIDLVVLPLAAHSRLAARLRALPGAECYRRDGRFTR